MRMAIAAIAVGALLLSASPIAASQPQHIMHSPSGYDAEVASPMVSPETSPPVDVTPGTVDDPRIVALLADDTLRFFPNVVQVVEGETITFQITTMGVAIHEFMLGPVADAFADVEGTAEVDEIGPGQTKSLTFTFDGPGPYAFACHEPGHFEAGMVGYIVVTGPDVPAVGTVASPRLVEVDLTDALQFMPADIPVRQGETVTFLLTNLGLVTHEFAVGPAVKVDADQVDGVTVMEADEITGHFLKTLTYTFADAGPYAYACHEPGHFEAGMRGTITIVGP